MMRSPATPLALLSFLLACDQHPVAPVIDAGPEFAKAGPDVNKDKVIRYRDHFAFSWTDPSSGLRATHTTFPIALFGEPEPDCGPQEDLAMIDFKQVTVVNPVDFFASEHINASGPVWVIVRDVTQPGDCYGVKLIAEGPGEIRYLDNDASGLEDGETGANSFGFIATGTLTTPDGRTLTYQGVARYVITNRNGEVALTPVVERVILG